MTTSEYSLTGKVALVTGAGRGIGRAISVAFAAAGASLCCVARSRVEIDDAAAEITANDGQALAITADVSNLAAVEAAFEQASAHFARLDIVVVNAGVSLEPRRVAEGNAEAWRRTIEVNLIGAYHTARAAIPHLKKAGGGKIIVIGSGLGRRPMPGSSAYSCSKAGTWMLTQVLAEELREERICVNELIPGPVTTSLPASAESGIRESASGVVEWQKQPEDVVPMALFLASQPPLGPTGQSFSLTRRIL